MAGEKAQQLREDVQAKIVKTITAKLEQGKITEARAKEIAKLVLEKLPEGISYDKLMEVLPTLDDHFVELAEVVVPIMVDYEKKVREAVDDKVSKLISEGKFNEALDVAKKAIEFEKNLA